MHLRKLLRIARWEVTKNAGGIDRRTVIVAVLALLALGVVGPVVAGSGGVQIDEGIYRVGVAESNPYYPVADQDPTFAVHDPAGRAALGDSLDLLIREGTITGAPTAKGRAAAQAFREAVVSYNDRQLRDGGGNRTAAFPVRVDLRYREQGSSQVVGGTTVGGDGDGGSGTDGGSDVGSDGPASPTDSASDGGRQPASGIGGLGSTLGGDGPTSGAPSDIAPPFPFESLVLAFVFVIPLNFLIQAYGSTMLSERLKRRGELLLVAPVTRTDIIAGKTLPYFLGALVVEGAIAAGLTYLQTGRLGGAVSVAAILPLVLLFLGATFLGAMFARSFKELTFVTVTITVTLTSYAFVPAIFTETGPVALISPLTLVVRDLQSEAITVAEFAFSVIPPTLTALVLFGLGAGLYREEDMFTQRPIPLKVLDALAGRIRRRWHVALLSGLLLPFVFVAELLVVAFLFALGQISIPIVLVLVAVIEEVGKSLHVYAAYAHRRFDRRLRTAVSLGILSGIGFFLAEKLSLLAQLVGLQSLPVGDAALTTGIVSGPLVIGFLVAPLALHTVTAAISAVGARGSRRSYLIGLSVAVVVHLAYNWTVVMVLG